MGIGDGYPLSEGYMIDHRRGETAGIVVRQKGERGFRFHSANRAFHALDGHAFATPAAAQRAVDLFSRCRRQGRKEPRERLAIGP